VKSSRPVAVVIACALAFLVSCVGRPAGTPQPDARLVVVSSDAGARVAYAPEDEAMVPIASDDAVRGNRLAYVTLVVFSDFQCSHCARLETTLARLRAEYGEDKLRIVFKNKPLAYHAHARLAAEIGHGVLALAGQEAFWRYHAMAFGQQANMSPETLRAWAVEAGVGKDALEEGLGKKLWKPKVERDVVQARRLGVEGTPGSFVNGVAIPGAQSFDNFKSIVDDELTKAASLVERGIERDKVYTRLASANFTRKDDDAQAAAEAKDVYKVPAGTAPVRGSATAQVTIIEFSDFQCPFCKRAEATLGRIRREYRDKVRLLWRDMPLASHQRAEAAAELARAARAQKGDAGFWTVHDLLLDSQPKLEDADLERIAQEAKLDVAKAMAAVQAKSFKRGIDEDMDLADDFNASGTPHFFINGRRMVGAKSFESFKTIIDEEIARADAILESGTPAVALYDAVIKEGKPPAVPEMKTIAAAAGGAPFRGAANAKVVIQEVADFQCPYCRRADATMEELLKAYPGKIKLVWRDKPLASHADAPLAAEAAREAHAQKGNEGFARMQKLLFDHQQALGRDDLDDHARTIGLDMKRFAHALDTRAHRAAVEADEKAATDAGVSGTPAFFIGPYYVSGAKPLRSFKRLVDLVLSGAPGARPSGRGNGS
jgi:protein-disulfide isomerase